MKKFIVCTAVLSAALAISAPAVATTYYVGPTGADEECTRAAPCALTTGAALAMAGDTVILLDGTYYEPLNPENSGTAEAWITFKADDCALPIIEGGGENPVLNESGQALSGVFSNTGSYLRFIGIASRHWDSGFTNGWTGEGTTNSNGHFEVINCIGDGNGRTGMVMYSAGGFTVRESISAHNGGNPTGSWSSGIQLYAVQGTPEQNIVERNISFENTDAEKNNDGSGFIVDEHTQGATFINNIAFRNGGSCMRLTRSDNTRMMHFSCYHNGMNPNANSPTNPGEFYFTDQQSRDTASLFNTLAAASGSETDPEVFRFPPESGLSNNLTVDSGPTPFYSDPEGSNPDFRPPATAAEQVENQGTPNGAPGVDIGFDPRCIIRQNPAVPYQQSWWTHSVDYDYIRSIGGIAQCFRPKQRTGGADLGAYELSGAPHAFSEPGSCVPNPVDDEEPTTGGTGSIDAGTEGSVAAGGSAATGTTSGSGDGAGGSVGVGGSVGAGGSAATTTTSAGSDSSGSGATGASAVDGGPATGETSAGAGPRETATEAEGCACRFPVGRSRRAPFGVGFALALGGLALLRLRRCQRRAAAFANPQGRIAGEGSPE